jgi:hypothetical protein
MKIILEHILFSKVEMPIRGLECNLINEPLAL